MKRIIAIMLLSVLLVLAFTACSSHECTFAEDWTYNAESHWHAATCEHTDKKSDVANHSFNSDGVCVCGAENIQKFIKALKDANPVSAKIERTETTGLDGIVLNGLYNVTYRGDGSALVVYEIDTFSDDFVSVNPVERVSGYVTVNADGTITGESGLNRGAHIVTLLNIDLASVNAKVSGDTIRFTVAKADTATALGVALDADAVVGITVINGRVVSVDITYASTVVTALYS